MIGSRRAPSKGSVCRKEPPVAGRRQHLTRTNRSADPASSGAGKPATEAFPVVGIGASAGGLDAASRLLRALPPDSGAAFILVQHLDPTHPSMMVSLLAEHTAMPVSEAIDGVRIAPGRVYVIPPGTYLSAAKGALRLSQPQARHGARLPFDYLLRSLADAFGSRAVCIVLSGTGADGSLGLRAVREKGGLIIAQDPLEAAHDGMPRSAIATGAVDHVLSIADMPAALAPFGRHLQQAPANSGAGPPRDRRRLDATHRRSPATQDRPRLHALQERYATAADRAAHVACGARSRGHGAISRSPGDEPG
ncbi:MAG TPA: chemotaxis protein CheB [Caulobacteraceae bacterium]